MTDDTLDLDKLRRVAEAALVEHPKPWVVERDGDVLSVDYGPEVDWPWRIKGVCNFVEEEATEEAAAYIAAWSPPTSLAMLDRLTAVTAERDAAQQRQRALRGLLWRARTYVDASDMRRDPAGWGKPNPLLAEIDAALSATDGGGEGLT